MGSSRGNPMFRTHLPTVFLDRASQKAIWEQEHAERLEDVEWLLGTVCQSFGFPLDSRYQFSPRDQLIDIYRSRYPRWKFRKLGDSLELETVIMEIEKRLGSCNTELYSLSLGEIVRRSATKQSSTHERTCL